MLQFAGVNGCISKRPSAGMYRRTCWPGFHEKGMLAMRTMVVTSVVCAGSVDTDGGGVVIRTGNPATILRPLRDLSSLRAGWPIEMLFRMLKYRTANLSIKTMLDAR
jgi:hypothetical protein